MASFVSHLECSLTAEVYPAGEVHGLSRAGGSLLVRYDAAAIRLAVSKDALAARADGFWRYAEFLPVEMQKNRVSLGEVATPLIRAPRIEALRGGGALFVKDESRLAAGSMLARGLALSVSMAKEFRLKQLAMAADGAEGVALAAYAARAGLRATIVCPAQSAPALSGEIAARGARIVPVKGGLEACARIVRDGAKDAGWFDVTPGAEPYFLEGAKTAGFELAEQFGWDLPEWIFLADSVAADAIAKAFGELEATGWISAKRPTIVIAAAGGGSDAAAEMAREEGIALGAGGAGAYAAYVAAAAERRVKRGARAVIVNSGPPRVHSPSAPEAPLDPHAPVDYARFRLKASGDD